MVETKCAAGPLKRLGKKEQDHSQVGGGRMVEQGCGAIFIYPNITHSTWLSNISLILSQKPVFVVRNMFKN